MPLFATRVPKFKTKKPAQFDWQNWRGGLNTLLRESELSGSEVTRFENLMLIGAGIPTKRWGTENYFKSGATSSVRGLKGFYQKDGTNELLAITDDGYLSKRDGTSYSAIAGVSWASGYNAEMVQLDDNMYIVNGQRELARYSGSALVGFATIGQPSGGIATQISGVSGTNTVSYRLTHSSQVGETAPTTAVTASNQPNELTEGSVKLSWANASAASGVRTGTNIYGRRGGDETFLASVDYLTTQWIDDGTATAQLFAFPNEVDTTGGITAKYIVRFKDRLILAGIENDPTMVMISGKSPNQENFDMGHGGGFIRIEPDSGDDITGLATHGDRLIVFKDKSIWQIKFGEFTYKYINFLPLTLLEPKAQLITNSIGCYSHRTIVPVENDLFFCSRKPGVYILGNEPGIIGDILRTNELSIKIRPFFKGVSVSEIKNANAVYNDNKYILSFPGRNQMIVFDRERQAWIGPWTVDGRVFETYYDSSDEPQILYGEDDSATVVKFNPAQPTDQGSAIETIMTTKKEDFGDWTTFKTIEDVFTRFKNVAGTVDVDIDLETKEGHVVTAKEFSITTGSGNSGWGTDMWGNTQWGDTEAAGLSRDLRELIKQAPLNKAARTIQMTIKTDGNQDKYELMGIKGIAREIGSGFRPSAWRV